MPHDIQKYRRHVEGFDLTDQEKDNLIRVVQSIMQNFVDRAFGDDPVQMCQTLNDAKRALDTPVVIDLEAREISCTDIELTGAFNSKNKKGQAT